MQQLEFPSEELAGTVELVMAAAWHSRRGASAVRAFSPAVRVSIKGGCVKLQPSHDMALTLLLIHPISSSWRDLANVQLFLYRIIDTFTPPADTDPFDRLDVSAAGSPAARGGAMMAQEQQAGLHLIAVGHVAIHDLVERRVSPSGIPNQVGARVMLDQVDSGMAYSKVSMQLEVSVQRLLPAGSKWHAVLELLRSRSEAAYFRKRLRKRLVRMRQNLHVLFESASLASARHTAASAPAAGILLDGGAQDSSAAREMAGLREGVALTNARMHRMEGTLATLATQVERLNAHMARIEPMLAAKVDSSHA